MQLTRLFQAIIVAYGLSTSPAGAQTGESPPPESSPLLYCDDASETVCTLCTPPPPPIPYA